VNDDFTGTPVNSFTGGTTPTVFSNDTLNGAAFANGAVTPSITNDGGLIGVTINANGTLNVPAGTPAGTYTVTYQICEVLNPTNCDTATATVQVNPPVIDAVNDDFTGTPVNSFTGGTTPTVFSNDTLNGAAFANGAVTPSVTNDGGLTGVTINANGTLTVPAGTPAGTYTVTYQICEVLNPTNCDTATAIVQVDSPVIDAVNDNGAGINGTVGGQSLANVLANDSLNGTTPVLLANVNLTQVSTTNPGVTLNPLDGSVNVAAGTPAGSYVVTYQICDRVNPTVCDTATVTVPVSAPSLELTKTNNAISVAPGGTTTYELTVTNSGAAPTSGLITVVDVLPADMSIANGAVTLGGANAADWTCNAASNVITCTSNVVIVVSGTSVFDFTVNVSLTASGTQLNKAKVGGGGDLSNPNPPTSITVGQCTGPNTPQGCATDSDAIGTALVADPAISKAGNPTLASVGETVVFTLTVTNNGNTPAAGVVVTDPLPGIFDVVGVTSVYQAGGNAGTITVSPAPAPYTVIVNLGTLNVTDVVIIRITTTVNGSGNPPITNTASLATTGTNLRTANDAAGVTIRIRTQGQTIPATGFAPNVVTKLRPQPQELTYAATDVTIEIPSLGIKLSIVGVPKKNGKWDVTWLENQAGWLEGTAFPSWDGNSVLTSHVYLSNGLPGPFVNLGKLKYGDKVIVHAYGQKYTFEVRTNTIVEPNDASIFKHEEKSWLTLVTCKEYDQKTNTYKKRVVIRAVLVKVEAE